MNKVIISNSAGETIKIGQEFAEKLKQGDVVAFFGELGSGKTAMIKGICKGLGVSKGVKSPSFVFLRMYKAKFTVYHFDFYRLRGEEELILFDYKNFFYDSAIVLLEWAERVRDFLPEERFDIRMKILNENKREICISDTSSKKPSLLRHRT